MEGMKFKFTILFKRDNGIEFEWKREVKITDVAAWAQQGNRTVAEECIFYAQAPIKCTVARVQGKPDRVLHRQISR